jgi:hypothetical protein
MSIRSTIELFTPEANFWECNQQFKIANPFKTIYNKDKSKGKKESSKLMWFVAHCYDMNSRFYNLDAEEKHTLIGEDFCGEASFYEDNKDLLDDLIEAFCMQEDTPAQRALRDWNNTILKRARFLRDTDYSLDEYVEDDRGKWITKKGTATQLDTMHKNTKSIYQDYDRIVEELEKEKNSGSAKGGSVASLGDSGQI